ncbi:MAG: GNAT family N-acetyltransferase [Lachnospiraceae bacterium]|nr:GNAT family N-acetyltransferase [Lachnospiraceae bacterium]
MEIKTPRLLIKPLGPAFLETVQQYAGDPENTKFMRDLPSEKPEDTLRFLTRAGKEWEKAEQSKDLNACSYYEFAVLWEGIHVAAVSLYPDEIRKTAELGWITNKAYWGHGFSFEAVQAVIAFAAAELHIYRFIAHCDTENDISRRFMEKLGMTRTAEYGGRHNKGSDEERREYEYELVVPAP